MGSIGGKRGRARHSTAGLAIPRSRPPRAKWDVAALLRGQGERIILWSPLATMAGAALYFAALREPAAWTGPAIAGAGTLAALLFAAWPTRRARVAVRAAAILCAMIAAAGLGLCAAQGRTHMVAAPRLKAPIGPVAVEGWVSDATMGLSRPRLKLLVARIEGLDPPPRYVEISTTVAGALGPGQAARCLAVLRTPSGPLAPGAYDPGFQAYFDRIGAVGFSYGACRATLRAPPRDRYDAALIKVAAWRRAITESIAYAAPGRGGAVAAALVTGDRSLIDPDTTRIFRDSGLGHLLSVSGVHMGLVGGMLYAAIYAGLALIAPLALRFPIRKWAAGAAIAAAGAYLLISGNSVPAQRSFVMIVVAMGAILVDRPAITLRGLGVAAFIVTMFTPESVVTPGFQMSFAASAALVAAFEAHTARRIEPIGAPGLMIRTLQRSWDWLSGALLASAVAGVATDPFALMHFQRMALYGLPTNLVATPVVSLVVAPAAMAAGLLAPFGLADPFLRIMGEGLDFLVAASAVFADRAEAVRRFPGPPDITFLLWIAAIAWACLWRGTLRWAGFVPAVAGLILYVLAPRPILWLDERGEAVLARAANPAGAHWTLMQGAHGRFEAERLGELAGLGPREVLQLPTPEACSAQGCAWKTPRGRLAGLARTPAAFQSLCRGGAIVVAAAPVPPGWRARCAPGALIEPADLARRGGAAITEAGGGVEVRYARQSVAAGRPWRTAQP
jgi:competence protein ComEC